MPREKKNESDNRRTCRMLVASSSSFETVLSATLNGTRPVLLKQSLNHLDTEPPHSTPPRRRGPSTRTKIPRFFATHQTRTRENWAVSDASEAPRLVPLVEGLRTGTSIQYLDWSKEIHDPRIRAETVDSGSMSQTRPGIASRTAQWPVEVAGSSSLPSPPHEGAQQRRHRHHPWSGPQSCPRTPSSSRGQAPHPQLRHLAPPPK